MSDFQCYNKPNLFLVDSQTGRFFHPDCGRYDCEFCAWKKIKKISVLVGDFFANSRVRFATLTTTNRYNSFLPDHLPVLAWREFIRNLRNWPAYSHLKNLRYIRIVEYQKNGNTHYHLLIDKYIDKTILNFLWRRACEIVLEKHGIFVGADIEKFANCHVEAAIDAAHVAKYVTKYLTKSIKTDGFRDRKTRRYRPYSVSRNIKFARGEKRPTGRWYRFGPGDLRNHENLYLFHKCLMPNFFDEKWNLCVTDSLYERLLGTTFDFP